MTRLLQPMPEAEIATDAFGDPVAVSSPLRGGLRPVARWRVSVDWWQNPVARDYWRVVFEDRLLLEIFRDLETGGWFIERIYD